MNKFIKYCFFVLLLFTCYSYAQSSWFWLNPGNGFFKEINFVNESTGYACGWYYGIVCIKTTNRGMSWSSNYVANYYPNDMYFLDQNTGWIASGIDGGIFKTSNGGANWVNIPLFNNTESIRTVHFMNSLVGVVGTVNWDSSLTRGLIYKTTNGGQNWIITAHNISSTEIFFINSNTGFACGHDILNGWGTILKTENAGSNWFYSNFPSNLLEITSIHFSGSTGFICESSGKICKSTDYGDNWFFVTNLYRNLKDLFFINNVTGWVVGANSIFKSTDSGITWHNDIVGQSQFNISSVCFTDLNNGYIVSNEWILKTTTGGGTPVEISTMSNEIPEKFSLFQNYPNPFNPQTKIKFDVPPNVKGQTLNVKLVIYDLLGREVTTLVNEQLKPGTYEADWDGSNFSSGVYFYKIITNEFTETKKMLMVK